MLTPRPPLFLFPSSVKVFRSPENAKRLRNSAERLMMAAFPEDRFVEAVRRVVADNLEYVPPYGTGGSMYIRPLLFGSGPRCVRAGGGRDGGGGGGGGKSGLGVGGLL
jgi:branched-subunit amino acid aminotransferase/4-amino-4-deoxychorismate lyase